MYVGAAMAPARRTKKYLLDPRFQLKWTGYLVVIVLLVMTALGVVIGRTAAHASDTAQIAVEQAQKAFEESRTNSALARQSVQIAAPDNPALASVMDQSLAEVDVQAQKNLEEVKQRQAQIAKDRRDIQLLLLGAGVCLVVLLFAMGIVITHRIVGPVHKMKRLLRRVSTGRLVVDERLRKGDELEDLFETFLQMTWSLRAMQAARLATLEGTLRKAEASRASDEVLAGLRALRAQLVVGLERRRRSYTSIPPPF